MIPTKTPGNACGWEVLGDLRGGESASGRPRSRGYSDLEAICLYKHDNYVTKYEKRRQLYFHCYLDIFFGIFLFHSFHRETDTQEEA